MLIQDILQYLPLTLTDEANFTKHLNGVYSWRRQCEIFEPYDCIFLKTWRKRRLCSFLKRYHDLCEISVIFELYFFFWDEGKLVDKTFKNTLSSKWSICTVN